MLQFHKQAVNQFFGWIDLIVSSGRLWERGTRKASDRKLSHCKSGTRMHHLSPFRTYTLTEISIENMRVI
jgi:hypothetical protein